MRVFLSHCINDSDKRPVGFRDTQDDFDRLKKLGADLKAAGFRVFEYQYFKEESRSADILEMMSRQIALSNAVVFVTTREEYRAPGWTVPELFCAFAFGKPVLCLPLNGAPLKADKYGDPVAEGRFSSLLPAHVFCLGKDDLVSRLRAIKTPETSTLDPFGWTEVLSAWADVHEEQWKADGKIEQFLSDYHTAWNKGFRPAERFLQPVCWHDEWGEINDVSAWLDDRHVVIQSGGINGGRVSVLDAMEGGLSGMPHDGKHQILTAGLSQQGQAVMVEHLAGNLFRFSRIAANLQVETFDAVLASAPVEASGVIADVFFHGSACHRMDWENGGIEKVPMSISKPQDFRRFGWGAMSSESTNWLCAHMDRKRDKGFWTILPPQTRYLRLMEGDGTGPMVVLHGKRLFCGRCPETGMNFGTDLPKVKELPDDKQQTKGGDVPEFLKALVENTEIPTPDPFVDRNENERTLSLNWRGANPLKNRALFEFGCSLEAAKKLAKRICTLDSAQAPHTSTASH